MRDIARDIFSLSLSALALGGQLSGVCLLEVGDLLVGGLLVLGRRDDLLGGATSSEQGSEHGCG
jgi:hypothetical protein